MKRSISLALKSILLIFTVLLIFLIKPQTAYADELYWNGYHYLVQDNEATITGFTGLGYVINIPDTIGGYPVTGIGPNAFFNNGVMIVTIPDSVTNIGGGAFYNCHSLVSATIGKGVTSIDSNTFGYCSNLASVTIPLWCNKH